MLKLALNKRMHVSDDGQGINKLRPYIKIIVNIIPTDLKLKIHLHPLFVLSYITNQKQESGFQEFGDLVGNDS